MTIINYHLIAPYKISIKRCGDNGGKKYVLFLGVFCSYYFLLLSSHWAPAILSLYWNHLKETFFGVVVSFSKLYFSPQNTLKSTCFFFKITKKNLFQYATKTRKLKFWLSLIVKNYVIWAFFKYNCEASMRWKIESILPSNTF